MPHHGPAPTVRTARAASQAYLAILVIALFYLAYRYPLQINSAQTSPTYTDTPTWLQAGKFLLMLLVATWFVGRASLSIEPMPAVVSRSPGASVSLALLACFAVGKGLLAHSTDLLAFGVDLAVGFLISTLALRWRLESRRVSRWLITYAVLSLVSISTQWFLYVSFGRLPALAYEDSVSVRFGGIIDDPNGYAILIALLVPTVFFCARRHTLIRFTCCTALVGSLVLTQSFTGAAAVVVALFCGIAILRWRRAPTSGVLIPLVLGVLAYGAYSYARNIAYVQQVLGTKAGSVASHAQSVGALQSLGVHDLLGFGFPQALSESGYVALLETVGAPFTLVYLTMGVVTISRLARRLAAGRRGLELAADYGFFFFAIAYLVGALNLQLIDEYPIDILYVLGFVYSLFAKVGAADDADRGRALDPTSLRFQPSRRAVAPAVPDARPAVTGEHGDAVHASGSEDSSDVGR